jgi:hypothetical protein
MRFKKFLVCSDLHGDMQDKTAVDALFKFCDSWKPEVRVFAGDLWDFRPLRRRADEHEKRERMQHDYDAGMMFLKRFRPQTFLLGNHDQRLWDLRDNGQGVVADYAETGVREIENECDKLKCKIYPYDKRRGIFRLGHLKVIHGFFAGVTAVRRTAQAYGSVLMGHGHAIDQASIEGVEKRIGRMIGALCRLDMDYNRAQVGSLRHAHGWAFGVVADSGAYQVWQAESVHNKWIVPTGVKEL